jgi:hypothetical protein
MAAHQVYLVYLLLEAVVVAQMAQQETQVVLVGAEEEMAETLHKQTM